MITKEEIKQKFILSKCKSKAAFSARLKSPIKLNLELIKDKFEVVMDTKILLVLRIDDVELICHGFGELLFKNCNDLDKMGKISEEIYFIGLN